MKNIIGYLSIVSIIISIFWCFKTSFDYEPILVLIASIIALITTVKTPTKNEKLEFSESESKGDKKSKSRKNVTRISGKRNKIIQGGKNDSDEQRNSASIKGNDNEVQQF